jgi:hypothetical protein
MKVVQMSDSTVDRGALAADLERARTDFHHLLAITTQQDWDRPTFGTRWTNEQLMFHMVFGYMIVARLLILVWLFARLPGRVSRRFANLLDASTPLFHVINYYGSCWASRVYNRDRMGARLDHTVDQLQRSLLQLDDHAFARGMHYPTRWDPYFRDYMTLAELYKYPGQHYDHHRQQLTLAKLGKLA